MKANGFKMWDELEPSFDIEMVKMRKKTEFMKDFKINLIWIWLLLKFNRIKYLTELKYEN
jgi:hypothetical protein